MKTVCLNFQVHQPFRLRRYRFFDIANDHYYYDDFSNETIMRKVADQCYLPANKILMDLIKKLKGQFKVAFSFSGTVLDQMELYAPDALESFQRLVKTGAVELLSEPNAHSLVSLDDVHEFRQQVDEHKEKIESLFGKTPKVFSNTELIYSDEIGQKVFDMGFKGMITDGARHVLGWKSPNYLYYNALNPRLKLMLKNDEWSDDIAYRFSDPSWPEYPLTSDKFALWLDQADSEQEVINLFMDYETFGEHQTKSTGIFDFLKAFPGQVLKYENLEFATPSEVIDKYQPVGPANVQYPISGADAEKDITAWLGNDLQKEAFNQLYALREKVRKCDDKNINIDWNYLQASNHFYYMSTKFFTDGDMHAYFNPYQSPYDAFINYMNILNDFSLRVEAHAPENRRDIEMAALMDTIQEKDDKIVRIENELQRLRKRANKQQAQTKNKSKTAAKKSSTSSASKK